MSDRVILKGVQTDYFRLQGAPHENYNKDGMEWSANFILNKEHIDALKEAGCGRAYIKKYKDSDGNVREPVVTYFKFTKRATLVSGDPAKPPLVLDTYGDLWNPSTLVGNGSTADIVVAFQEMSAGPNKGKLKPVVLKTVLRDVVEYAPNDGIEYTKKEEVTVEENLGDVLPQEDDEWEAV